MHLLNITLSHYSLAVRLANLSVSTVRPQGPEDLFETISQAMLNAVDRDAVSGMGVVVHVM